MKHRLLAGLATAIALAGCAAPKPIQAPLPALPAARLLEAAPLPRLALVSPPRPARVTLAWDCVPSAEAEKYFTALEATTDFIHWSEVARLPYQPTNQVTLTNRPAMEFYRALNGIR